MPRTAHAQLYVTQLIPPSPLPGGFVSEYDVTIGEVTNAKLITGLFYPVGVAVKGNTLFVADTAHGTVGEYDAKTGAAINAKFIAVGTKPADSRC